MASGALRVALKAGQWARAAAESRRQARAMRQLSDSGFVRDYVNAQKFDPISADTYLRGRGVNYDGPPNWSINGQNFPRGSFMSESPFGGTAYVLPGVGRQRFGGEGTDWMVAGGGTGDFGNFDLGYRRSMMAPYEGMRTWRNPLGFGPQSFDALPPWSGGGTPPPFIRNDY
jgi:hypothetical protein